MGVVKDEMLRQAEEENGVSSLSWTALRQVLNNISELYGDSDILTVDDLIDRIAGFRDHLDPPLAHLMEDARFDEELDEALAKDD